eukprot:3654484-Amphidinium_carterae.1
MTSVASKDHFSNIQLKSKLKIHTHTHTLTAVNGEQINIYGSKQVTLVYKNLAIPTTFILADVNCAILGLDTIARNGLRLSVNGSQGHLEHVRLHSFGNHFYLNSTAFDGPYSYVDYTPDFANWYYNWYDEYNQLNMVYGLIQDDAQPLPLYRDTSLEINHNKKQAHAKHSRRQ